MSKEDLGNTGLSLGLTIIVLGIIIQFVFLDYELALWIATFLIGFGIAGMGIEIEKTNSGKGFDSIGVGTLFFLPSFLSLFNFSNVWIKIILMIPLMIGIFGIILGISKQINLRKNNKNIKENSILNTGEKIEIFFSLIGFISNIVTIIAFFSN